SNLLHETRSFPPPPELAANAVATPQTYADADADRLGFWAKQAARLEWSAPPFAKWFTGGQLNVAVNCVDRHVAAGLGDRVAYHWVGEPGDTRTITYAELLELVCRAANALATLGVR